MKKRLFSAFLIAAFLSLSACAGTPGETGPQGPQGEQGVPGLDGEPGRDGKDGADGISVVSVVHTSSDGVVDTYTITYSNGSTSTFTVRNGEQGIQGNPGADGHTPVITIGNNGNWFVDYTDTGIKAQGPKGDIGPQGVSIVSINKTATNGLIDTYTILYSDSSQSTFTVTNGAQGIQGIQGEPGADGHTPVITIGSNGYWYVDGVNTNIKAQGPQGPQGPQGAQGISVVSIIKTGTQGLVDTYTITYSDNSKTTFTVTNGEQGIQGIQGEAGQDGHTPIITIGLNGNWFIDGVDTTIKAQGPQGETGPQGEQGISVVSAVINEDGDLIITLSDGTTQNAGHVKDVSIYTVNFYIGDQIVATRSVPAYSKVARPTEEEIAGYHVDYWYTKDGSYRDVWNFQGCVITEDTNIYAEYQAIDYVISFVDNTFNNVVADYRREYNQAYSLPLLTHTGYDFLGWYDSNNNKMANTGTYNIPHDITLYARWSAKTYVVTFALAGGSVNGSTANFTRNYTYGTRYTLPTPTRTGFFFEGWLNGSELVPQSVVWSIASNVTLVANWSSTRTYTFNAGAGSVETVTQTISYGENYTLPTPTPPEGLKFDGWYAGSVKVDAYIPLTGTWTYVGSDTTLVAHYYDKRLTMDEYSSYSVVRSSSIGEFTRGTLNIPGYYHGKRTKDSGVLYSKYGIQNVVIEEGCYQIDASSMGYQYCYNLISITIPSTMESISKSFGACYKLTRIINHSSINIVVGEETSGYIGRYAREVIQNISQSKMSVDSGDFVHYKEGNKDIITNWIGEIVLNGDGKHVKTIPNGVTEIADYAFYYCESRSVPFHEITLPVSLQYIGAYAFYTGFAGIPRLSVINYRGTMSQWSQITLGERWNDSSKAEVVHCIDGDVDL